jgi:hypothetical protein
MIRPQRQKPSTNAFAKFVRIFGLLMTTLYIGLGLFIIFADKQMLNLNIPDNYRVILGGILILYGTVRFIRVYQTNSKRKRNEE